VQLYLVNGITVCAYMYVYYAINTCSFGSTLMHEADADADADADAELRDIARFDHELHRGIGYGTGA